MEIFPSGGGSYRIASQLLGPKFGLVSGSAQVVDYVLTIAPLLLGNMATDSWLPHRFRNLSSRLVREDGVVCLTLLVVASGIVIQRQYDWVSVQRQKLDKVFELPKERLSVAKVTSPDPAQSTAIFLTTDHWGPTIHTLLWVHRIFHERFRNWVFVSAVEVQASALSAPETVPDCSDRPGNFRASRIRDNGYGRASLLGCASCSPANKPTKR
ncbi:MAG: hypothetical protein IPK02_10525 [Candidatus Accumulibacter sp.]|uniref:Uncharacterized protein n=1 Tax=Candidatus Accumulibacter affinis TaxID=2954384 RepID=A0A935TBF3_9PROT|nr:hypothetical protein [Candidatus Accumulibacter affinis]